MSTADSGSSGRRPGRPRKAIQDKKSVVVRVRLSPAEAEAYALHKAELEGAGWPARLAVCRALYMAVLSWDRRVKVDLPRE